MIREGGQGMIDHIDDAEAPQAMARRLRDGPRCEAPAAHIDAAVQTPWDVDGPEGRADRLREQGQSTTAQCGTCGKIMLGAATCERRTGSDAVWQMEVKT